LTKALDHSEIILRSANDITDSNGVGIQLQAQASATPAGCFQNTCLDKAVGDFHKMMMRDSKSFGHFVDRRDLARRDGDVSQHSQGVIRMDGQSHGSNLLGLVNLPAAVGR